MSALNKIPDHSPRFSQYFMCCLFIISVPVAVHFYTLFKLNSGTPVRLAAHIKQVDETGLASTIHFQTPLNVISTSRLTGEKSFIPGDKVYVFLSAGPNDIWYPYALSKRSPESGCSNQQCLVIGGTIDQVSFDTISMKYSFEKHYPSPRVLSRISDIQPQEELEIVLAVSNTGHAMLRDLQIGDGVYDQRNMLKFAPPAFSSLGDNSIPATNPPK